MTIAPAVVYFKPRETVMLLPMLAAHQVRKDRSRGWLVLSPAYPFELALRSLAFL